MRKHLLWEARKRAVKKGKFTWIKHLYDKLNKHYGWDTDTVILLAKDYIFGNVVSCHAQAVVKAFQDKKNIVMFIKKAGAHGRFYEFNPDEILDHSKENYRNGIRMLNFNIKLSKRWG